MKKIKKDFDAVKSMRTIRDRLSAKYLKDASAFKEEIKKINKKYGIPEKSYKIKSLG